MDATEQPQQNQQDQYTKEAKGPLLYDDLHRKVKELQPTIFDGIRLTLSRPLSPHLQLSHSMSMGMINSAFVLRANYMGSKQVSPVEAYPLLASELQADGQMTANLIHLITPRLKGKVAASFARSQCIGSQASLDYIGDNFTSTFTAANIDLIKNSGIIIGHLLHQLTKRISIGPEVFVQYGHQNMASQLSLGGRYAADKYSVDATLSFGGAHVTYHQKANENLEFGAELMTDRSVGQSNAGFYYQYQLTKAHTVFRGSLDTAWNVGAVLEKRFYPLPVVLSMSAVLSHPKNSTTVGLGLNVG